MTALAVSAGGRAADPLSALRQENAELREHIVYLERELGLRREEDLVSKICRKWSLTPHEGALVGALYASKGRACSKGHLLDFIYQGRDEPEMKIIDVFVCKARRKLGDDFLATHWGKGYSLTARGTAEIDALASDTLLTVQPEPRAPTRSLASCVILARLSRGAATSQELRSLAGVTTQTFGAAIGSLQRAGYVTEQRSEGDRGLGLWDATTEGREAAARWAA